MGAEHAAPTWARPRMGATSRRSRTPVMGRARRRCRRPPARWPWRSRATAPGAVPPQGVPKRLRRREGFDAQGLSLSARGLPPHESQGPLAAL